MKDMIAILVQEHTGHVSDPGEGLVSPVPASLPARRLDLCQDTPPNRMDGFPESDGFPKSDGFPERSCPTVSTNTTDRMDSPNLGPRAGNALRSLNGCHSDNSDMLSDESDLNEFTGDAAASLEKNAFATLEGVSAIATGVTSAVVLQEIGYGRAIGGVRSGHGRLRRASDPLSEPVSELAVQLAVHAAASKSAELAELLKLPAHAGRGGAGASGEAIGVQTGVSHGPVLLGMDSKPSSPSGISTSKQSVTHSLIS